MAVSAIRDPLYAAVQRAEREDPHVREVLELIAGESSGTTRTVRRVAADLNRERGRQLREAFIAGALTSWQVAGLLDVADHRAVAARRARGTLLGLTVGNETYHPDWQFSETGTVAGLNKVLAAVREVTTSPLAADQLMRRPRSDLDGRALVDLLADGQVGLVQRLVRASVA